MSGVAIIFPGQGAQRSGMGRDFYDGSVAARAVYEEASDTLGVNLQMICFERNGRLGLTEWTQPALLATELAMLRTLEAECGLQPNWFGGHSLGEYTALAAASVLSLADAVRLVHERGRRMQAEVASGTGSMVTVTGRNLDMKAIRACLEGLAVDVACENSQHQVVLSGRASAMAAAEERLRRLPNGPALQLSQLAVSVPFHCRMLVPMEPAFRVLLRSSAASWRAERADAVTSNATGGFHRPDSDAVVDALTQQISSCVRWAENARALAHRQPSLILEIGPTSVLRGLLLQAGIRARAITTFIERYQLVEANVEQRS